jgi:hypothetical protein
LKLSYPGTARPSSWSSWLATPVLPLFPERSGRAKRRFRSSSVFCGPFDAAFLEALGAAAVLACALSPADAGAVGAASFCGLVS